MNRSTVVLLVAALAASAGCKKKVATEAPPPSMPALAPSPAPPEVQELKANFERVYFDTDSSELNAPSKQMLEANAKILQKSLDIHVNIQGHADERGTSDYNLALGDKRASAVEQYLVQLGVAPQRLDTISYGEEMPASTGHSESAWSQNRRVEFVVSWK